MQSRLNVNSPWGFSVAIHAGIVVTFLLGAFIAGRSTPRTSVTEFKVIDKIVQQAPATPFATSKKPPPKEAKPARAVFGVNRNTLTTDSAGAVQIKKGNTLAKPPDKETLRDDDPDSLPNPVEEFLVSQMPTLAAEVRIPYPPEAKSKGVQGAVVMDVLIDQEGKVRDAKLLSGPGSGLDEAAMKAVKEFRFKPALVEGKAVAVRIRYAYRFVLEH